MHFQTKDSYANWERVVRDLVGLPVFAYNFDCQDDAKEVHLYTDTDVAGCKNTRRSTSGGVTMMGSHTLRPWSNTQSTIALSSCEAELSGLGTGIAEALGFQSLARVMGFEVEPSAVGDAMAAI